MKNLKKVLSLILVASIAVGFTACGSKAPVAEVPAAPAATFKAGTYEGEAEGFHGKIKVKVTLSDEEITDIAVEQTETPGVGDQAIEEIVALIKANTSLKVDAVSGATYSSNGILAAVTAALEKAGADVAKLKSKEIAAGAATGDVEKTADVIIIGGGGAGLAAAVTAHQNGSKVILIEKMSRLGGNTLISGGAHNAADPVRQPAQNIEDSTEKHFQQTFEGGDKQADPALVRILAENTYDGIVWLESLGMEFKKEVFTVLGGMWPRAHKPVKPLGTGYIETYANYLDANKDGIEVILDTKATDFIVENGAVVGVNAEGKNGKITLRANKGVVLATGGFGANVEMRDQYNKNWPKLTSIKTTNHTGATGDGILMAQDVNVKLVGMENIQLLPMGDPQTGSLSGNIEQGVENRIFVNKEGSRFVDEGQRRDVMTKALMEQTDTSMWVIVDKHSYPTGDTKNNFNETIDDLVAAGRAFKADTLEELAEKIGADKAAFVKSVEDFNKSVDGTTKDAFGRTLFDQKIDTAPYYAGARVPTVHHTMGGVTITENAQVVDVNGNIIKGLYAAGEVTGGIHGTNRLGGNALADITVFGRIAGDSASNAK